MSVAFGERHATLDYDLAPVLCAAPQLTHPSSAEPDRIQESVYTLGGLGLQQLVRDAPDCLLSRVTVNLLRRVVPITDCPVQFPGEDGVVRQIKHLRLFAQPSFHLLAFRDVEETHYTRDDPPTAVADRGRVGDQRAARAVAAQNFDLLVRDHLACRDGARQRPLLPPVGPTARLKSLVGSQLLDVCRRQK